jgi:hypothetical protein
LFWKIASKFIVETFESKARMIVINKAKYLASVLKKWEEHIQL